LDAFVECRRDPKMTASGINAEFVVPATEVQNDGEDTPAILWQDRGQRRQQATIGVVG